MASAEAKLAAESYLIKERAIADAWLKQHGDDIPPVVTDLLATGRFVPYIENPSDNDFDNLRHKRPLR